MRVFIFAVLIFFLLSACRSTNKITTVVAKKDSVVLVLNPADSDSAKQVRATLNNIKSKRINFETFSSKLKIDYSDDNNRRLDFNAFLRMKKDSVIWVSIIAAFNIEAFRIMILPDAIVVLDKLNRTVQRRPFAYLKEITKVPFDFSTLEDIIMGNPVYLDQTVVAYAEQDERISLSTIGEAFKHYLTVGKADLHLLFSKLDDVDITRSRTANLAYADYIAAGPWMFAGQRKISLSEKTKLDLTLEFKQVEFNKPLGFPFSIPKNYKVIQ